MTDLYLVREEAVPVEQLRAGDRLILPSGQRVTVECVEEIDGLLFVRWWRRAEHGEPGHPGGKDLTEFKGARDGRYLGSLYGRVAGETVRVDRG